MKNRRQLKTRTSIVPAIGIALFAWFIIRELKPKPGAPSNAPQAGGNIPGYSDLY